MPTFAESYDTFTPPVIPPANECQVWIDFDGTLTQTDVLDALIEKYSRDDSWRAVEESWRDGRIGSRACLEFEFNLLRIRDHELDADIREVQLDAGAKALFGLLRNHGVPTTILSDGVDWIIERIIRRAGIPLPEIRANSARHEGESLQLVCLGNNPICTAAAAHCKCASRDKLHKTGRMSIYIGDGQSDLCAARGCEIVFAKNHLAEAFAREGQPIRKFVTLHDVCHELSESWLSVPAVEPVESTLCLSPHQL
ncbi:MAG: MtnX-like HAD-IB family phosphatase [Planctomycetes bacterium]|nr:MtnX-like HAD-IB family phosphatase [Planctomycetota bacterium]MBI3833921.1 MtnX-like HAD-IB family phosphatase [Planctomycetota bacterium]